MSNELKRVDVRLKLVEGEGLETKNPIENPNDAVLAVAAFLSTLDREEVCVVNVDGAGNAMNFNIVSIGDVNSALIPVQNVFKSAILSNAASIILLHNHPSSRTKPSKQDLEMTRKIMFASSFMNIPVLDHIIVAGTTGKYRSMKAENPLLFEPELYLRQLSSVADGGAKLFTNEVREEVAIYRQDNNTRQYGIYQITRGGEGEAYQFFGTDFAKEQGIKISGKDYSLIYTGEMEENETLDSLYQRFNIDRPKDFSGHSLSVSDVILWQTETENKAYYVDSFGFTELPDFVSQREEEIGVLEERDEREKNHQKTEKEQEKQGTSEKKKGMTVKEITEKLEQGLEQLFDSDNYKEYLNTMSKFHNYSFNNTLLIAMQKPDSSLVASYGSWKKNFNRQVMKGERGIRIIAPTPYKKKVEREVVDPQTRQVVKDNSGNIKKEEVEVTMQGFKVVSVFDISQTEGDPLPQIGADELLQSVDGYDDFVTAVIEISPVPVAFDEILGSAKGYFSPMEQRIVVRNGMSESQILKTLVHEVAHSLLHDKANVRVEGIENTEHKTRSSKEVEAESVAYTVCQHFGMDTSDYSFSYVAGWSSGKELKELKASMETIRKTASTLINDIEGKIQELRKERELEPQEVVKMGDQMREVLDASENIKKVGEVDHVAEYGKHVQMREMARKR